MNMTQKKRRALSKSVLLVALCLITCVALLPVGAYAKIQHTHTDECYCPGGELVCELEENDSHAHTDECYCPGGELICDKDDEIKSEDEDGESLKDASNLKTEGLDKSKISLLSGGINEAADFASLQEAIDNAADNTKTEITITDDLEFTKTLVIPKAKNIVLKTASGKSVTCSSASVLESEPMISVAEGAALTLDGDITLDGSSALGYVLCNGAFTMNSGTMTGCNISSSNNGLGGITVAGENAVCKLNGGTIEKTTSRYGHKAAVYVKDNAKLVLDGASINNNEFSNQFCAAVVVDGAEFEMNSGEISGNITAVSEISSGGGVLVMGLKSYATKETAESASFVMNGGKISNNESNRGGGVYVMGGHVNYTDFYSKASFTMNGGEITGNKTTNYNTGSTTIVSAGAGIYIEWAGEVTMNGGTISNNATDGMGGGVATNDGFTNFFGKNSYSSAGNAHYNELYYRNWDSIFPAAFTMNGGSITGNSAMSTSVTGDQGCGGGVYVASNNVVLNAGDISNNKSGKQGGGVYVGSVPYVLTMMDALITGNSASIIGGGVWLCPTGEIDASINNGAALYGNSAKGAADDLAAVHSVSNYTAIVASHMLGGGLSNWYQDGGVSASTTLGTADSSIPRYDANSNNNTPVSDTSLMTGCVSLKSVPTEESQEAAKNLAKLTVTGNKSTRGGGVGSNGDVEIGKSFNVTRELTINKEWFGSDDIPDSITVKVLIDGYEVQSVTLTKAKNWTATVGDLPISGEITVEEDAIDNWTAEYEYDKSNSGDVTATITNNHNPGDEPNTPGDDEENSEPDKGAVNTGDDMNIIFWIVLLALSALAVGGILYFTRKGSNK